MLVITYDSVIDLLTGFLEQNARLIIGTIVNVFVVYVIFKLIDLFNKKFLTKDKWFNDKIWREYQKDRTIEK